MSTYESVANGESIRVLHRPSPVSESDRMGVFEM